MNSVTIVQSPEGKRLIQALKILKDASVKVGWISGSKYPETEEYVAAVAVQNEYGDPRKNIPARPFMRPTIVQNEKDWRKTAEEGARKVLKKELTIANVLDLIGFQAESDIKKTIKSIYYPALAEKTILARIERNKRLSSKKGQLSETDLGNVTKPLIDSKIMFNSITHEVIS